MYVHELYASSDYAGIRHFRHTVLPSTLIKVEEIARSRAGSPHIGDYQHSSGLTISRGFGPALPERPDQSIDCEDLDDMIAKGVEAWNKLRSNIGGSALHVEFSIGEHYSDETETVHTSGLVVPRAPEDVVQEFKGYLATPAEIDAIDRLADRVNAGPSDLPTYGNYL